MESVRTRPAMYIGNDGTIGLIKGLLLDCIDLCLTHEIAFEILVSGNNQFCIGISSPHDLSPFLDRFFTAKIELDDYNHFPGILRALSDKLEISTKDRDRTEISFSLNKTAIEDSNFYYLKLSERMIHIALLNRRTEITTVDTRGKHVNQNYYHFPEGVFYLFDRATTEVLGKPKFKLQYDGSIGANTYQIGLAYRTDWYSVPNVESFANDVHTISGGSLVVGILHGLRSACKLYIRENNLGTHKLKSRKFRNGLIIVCAVRGENFKYEGSFREQLMDEDVEIQAKKIVQKLTIDFLRSNKAVAHEFLLRFDETHLTSGTY